MILLAALCWIVDELVTKQFPGNAEDARVEQKSTQWRASYKVGYVTAIRLMRDLHAGFYVANFFFGKNVAHQTEAIRVRASADTGKIAGISLIERHVISAKAQRTLTESVNLDAIVSGA